MRCVLALFVVVCMVRLSLAHGDGSSGPVRFAGTFGPLCLYILSLLTRVRTVMAFSGGTWAEATAVASWIVMGGGDGSVTLAQQIGVMASVVGVFVALGRLERLATPFCEM